jgi:hypothetical protein
MVCDCKSHVPTTQLFNPTQLRVKPATSITTGPTPAYISNITTTVNTTTANTKPSTYMPTTTTTAVNVTTDTTYKTMNAHTTEYMYVTAIMSIAYTTKDEGDKKRSTKARNAEGEWIGGGQRDKTGGTRTKASTTSQSTTTSGHTDQDTYPR